LSIKKLVLALRNYRKWHKWVGISLAIFILISALTGILLSWKKEVDLLQPPTQKGQAKSLGQWLPLDTLASLASSSFYQLHPDQSGNPIDRIDVRPGKGIAKVLFENGYWEVQIDGATGSILSTNRRHSDWIEALHDGSIIADWFKWLSMNYLGLGLVFMILSGFWLWLGPKRIRDLKLNK
jgi:uncharacterized iron-regulated membrane protein